MLKQIGERSKKASKIIAGYSSSKKNEALLACADALNANYEKILEANEKDYRRALEKNMKESLLDRLKLTKERIGSMAEGLSIVASLDDPVGSLSGMKKRPNGLMIGKMSVPLGVIGVIYEARPNVTSDVFGLCFKSGNACILKGGSDAIESNKAIAEILRGALSGVGAEEDAVILIEDVSRETARQFMHMNEYLDLIIPRGGAGLIRTVAEESTVPVIATGTGNCHIYVDEFADLDMALKIVDNAKTQRIGVCNAAESLLVHEAVAAKFLPKLASLFKGRVELRADSASLSYLDDAKEATDEDWGTEYLDYILSVKTVSSVDEAIDHINRYNTGHSEAIITGDLGNSTKFLKEVDAACVYVNASTRFTDGFEFGFGAEIGISTQKLHARGPMGLEALTTCKYVILGNGQTRG